MNVMEQGGGSSIELWLAERDDAGLDSELRRRVQEELVWEPGLDFSGIEVEARDRAITLRGSVRTYSQRVAAARAAGRVARVQTITNELRVDLAPSHERTDAALLEEATNVLRWDALVPQEHLRVSVCDCCVTLEGSVEWEHEREAAEQALQPLIGVKGIDNHITVRPKYVTGEVQSSIMGALRHHRELHTRNVHVETRRGVVVLRGCVPSLAERAAIEHAVWSVPGVTEVVDELVIEF